MFAQVVFYSMLWNCEWFLSQVAGVHLYSLPGTVPLTFLRKSESLGCAAQLPTKRIICLFCAPIRVSKEWKNKQNISVIHALLFAWYFIGNFLTYLKHLGFEDFPITIGTCLSLPSLLTHSSTMCLSLECFPPWQVSPLYAKVLSGSTLKNSPVSSALYTSRGS
jgi:hypothetical protein